VAKWPASVSFVQAHMQMGRSRRTPAGETRRRDPCDAPGVNINALYYGLDDRDVEGLIDVGSATRIEAHERASREFFSRDTKVAICAPGSTLSHPAMTSLSLSKHTFRNAQHQSGMHAQVCARYPHLATHGN
jgi:hypothetical protein